MAKEVINFLKYKKNHADFRMGVGDAWHIDIAVKRTDVSFCYEDDFRPLLKKNETFQSLIDTRKRNGKSTHTLDLMGSGGFIKWLDTVDSLTGVRLLDVTRINQDGNNKTAIVEGNIYSRKTWRNLSENMEQRNIPGFDLIVCRPVAPFDDPLCIGTKLFDPEIGGGVYYTLLKYAYDLISPNDGEIYTELPWLRLSSERRAGWIQKLRDAGIVITDSVDKSKDLDSIKIIKRPNSPVTLPLLDYKSISF